jgi:isopentenyldiphosphate isomerase
MINHNERLEVVNEKGSIINKATRKEVHDKGLLHREVHVWLYNKRGEVVLQKRSKNQETFPGMWDASVGGHVDLGEKPLEAAIRELKEETGLLAGPGGLKLILKIHTRINDPKSSLINNALQYEYAYRFDGGEDELKIEKGKATELKFWPIKKILGLSEKERKNIAFFYLPKEYLKVFEKIKNLC